MTLIFKADVVNELAEKMGVGQKHVKTLLDGLLESMGSHLKAGDKVQLTGFGTFEIKERSAQTGVNPKTSQKIENAASKYPAFKAEKSLEEEIAQPSTYFR